jgi:hypothetical protein
MDGKGKSIIWLNRCHLCKLAKKSEKIEEKIPDQV